MVQKNHYYQYQAQVAQSLRRLIGRNQVIIGEQNLKPYECDGLSAYRQLPLAVVLPESVDQVIAVVNFCRQRSIAVIARGAGTGLSGGALPREDAIILSLAKLNRVLNIDNENLLATVQPGITNLAISNAVKHLGLYYAPDPSSQIACTIGGNIAENSGGVHCLKYGLTLHNVAQLKIVTIEGELLTIGTTGFDSPGYDLLALMIGSEGMLGIVVEVTVRLLPIADATEVLMVSFDNIEYAGNAVAEIIAAGIIPAGLEMMDRAAIHAAEQYAKAGYDLNAVAILLCELDGDKESVTEQIQVLEKILLAAGASQLQQAENEQQRARFWSGRKAAFPAVGRIAPDYYCMDGTIPRHQLGFVLTEIARLSTEYDLPVANVFHAGDGNLHPLILYDANREGELEKTEEFGGRILELCVEVGGTVTGEHGVGVEKLDQMCIQFNSAEITQFHALKRVFDPDQLLNPGKAIPTLHRCAEFGAMHVHRGQLAHPELERF